MAFGSWFGGFVGAEADRLSVLPERATGYSQRVDQTPGMVFGATVDNQTRCVHYHTELDVVAIKFFCCGRYYPCCHCHDEAEHHPIVPWPADRLDTGAVLCGVCGSEFAISSYLAAARCPECDAAFNPRCARHRSIYFQVPDQEACAGEHSRSPGHHQRATSGQRPREPTGLQMKMRPGQAGLQVTPVAWIGQ